MLLLGLILGMRHATDPDHVAAMMTIVSGERSFARASRVGALWGIGHSLPILLLGGAIVVFRLTIPPRHGRAGERLGAVMLLVLGALTLGRHSHPPNDTVARPVMVGLVHGLAGSAFVAMLVLTAAPSILVGMTYLALFGLGTIAGMALITAGIAAPAALTPARFPGAPRYLRLASGLASIAFGLFLVHRVGFVDGLFTSTPHWTPQ